MMTNGALKVQCVRFRIDGVDIMQGYQMLACLPSQSLSPPRSGIDVHRRITGGNLTKMRNGTDIPFRESGNTPRRFMLRNLSD